MHTIAIELRLTEVCIRDGVRTSKDQALRGWKISVNHYCENKHYKEGNTVPKYFKDKGLINLAVIDR